MIRNDKDGEIEKLAKKVFRRMLDRDKPDFDRAVTLSSVVYLEPYEEGHVINLLMNREVIIQDPHRSYILNV